jgi:hypothetical protein
MTIIHQASTSFHYKHQHHQQGCTKCGSLVVGLAAKPRSGSQYLAEPQAQPANPQDRGSQSLAVPSHPFREADVAILWLSKRPSHPFWWNVAANQLLRKPFTY